MSHVIRHAAGLSRKTSKRKTSCAWCHRVYQVDRVSVERRDISQMADIANALERSMFKDVWQYVWKCSVCQRYTVADFKVSEDRFEPQRYSLGYGSRDRAKKTPMRKRYRYHDE